MYPSEYEKLAIVKNLGKHPKKTGIFVYDLRFDPEEYLGMSVEQLVNKWKYKKDSDEPRLPIKTLQFNRCPAVAPLGVIKGSEDRLSIDLDKINTHQIKLKDHSDFYERIKQAAEIIESDIYQPSLVMDISTVDSALYDGFISDDDKQLSKKVLSSDPSKIMDFKLKFSR